MPFLKIYRTVVNAANPFPYLRDGTEAAGQGGGGGGELRRTLTFSKKGETAFTTTGFNIRKKATEKFTIHESCSTHGEAKLKWSNIGKPSIRQQVDTQMAARYS